MTEKRIYIITALALHVLPLWSMHLEERKAHNKLHEHEEKRQEERHVQKTSREHHETFTSQHNKESKEKNEANTNQIEEENSDAANEGGMDLALDKLSRVEQGRHDAHTDRVAEKYKISKEQARTISRVLFDIKNNPEAYEKAPKVIEKQIKKNITDLIKIGNVREAKILEKRLLNKDGELNSKLLQEAQEAQEGKISYSKILAGLHVTGNAITDFFKAIGDMLSSITPDDIDGGDLFDF